MNKAELLSNVEALAQISEFKRTHFQVWNTQDNAMLMNTLKHLVATWMESLRNAKNAAKGLGMLAAKEGGKLTISLENMPDVIGQRQVAMKIEATPPSLVIELVAVQQILGADGKPAAQVETPSPTTPEPTEVQP